MKTCNTEYTRMSVTNINLYQTKIIHKTNFMMIQMPIYKYNVYFLFVIVSERAVHVCRNEFPPYSRSVLKQHIPNLWNHSGETLARTLNPLPLQHRCSLHWSVERKIAAYEHAGKCGTHPKQEMTSRDIAWLYMLVFVSSCQNFLKSLSVWHYYWIFISSRNICLMSKKKRSDQRHSPARVKIFPQTQHWKLYGWCWYLSKWLIWNTEPWRQTYLDANYKS